MTIQDELKNSKLQFYKNKYLINKIVLDEVVRNNQIIAGSVAMNKQLTLSGKRNAQDWDIHTKRPEQSANLLQKKLDKTVANRRDEFFATKEHYIKQSKSRNKLLKSGVKNVGWDNKKNTADDIGIVDYTSIPKNRRIVKINGMKYVSIKDIEKDKKSATSDPDFKHRWEKDKKDLNRIKLFGRR